MSTQEFYQKVLTKLMKEKSVQIKCAEESIPKLRTGISRARTLYSKATGDSEVGRIKISYNGEFADVKLVDPKNETSAEFTLL